MNSNPSKKTIAIVCSKDDPASLNIKNQLLEFGFSKSDNETYDNEPVYYLERENYSAKLYTISKDAVFFDEVNDLKEEYVVFPSEHRSEKNVPSLTVHCTGLWSDDTTFGGKPKSLSIAWPAFLKESFLILKQKAEANNLKDIMITPEVTHHGPFVKKPHAFIEIGSTEEQWNNAGLAKIIASTIIETLDKIFSPDYHFNYKVAFGIGGTHYCNNFIKVFLSKEFALSHICPKYATANLDDELILQALSSSEPKAEIIILDWKGIQDRQRIKSLLESMKIEYLKTKNIKF